MSHCDISILEVARVNTGRIKGRMQSILRAVYQHQSRRTQLINRRVDANASRIKHAMSAALWPEVGGS